MNVAQQEAAYLNSVAAQEGYNVAQVLDNRANYFRSKANSVKTDAAKKKWTELAAQYDAESSRAKQAN